MTFEEYQQHTAKTAIYTGKDTVGGLVYTTLGLTGEAGEIANKVKKILRDSNGVLTAETRMKLLDEAGDCQWYLSQLVTELRGDLANVASSNIAKLTDRLNRGVIKGEGDNR